MKTKCVGAKTVCCNYSLVIETLLLDHGEVALPALPLTAVMVPHGPGHLLIVHLLRPVGLHPTPRLGKLNSTTTVLSKSFKWR